MNSILPLISIVVPCYNEEESVPIFIERISAVASNMPDTEFEFIFVDDGSRDGTLAILRELSAKNERARYISFSRNFGKEAAILAGFEAAVGDYIAVMDADLQDPPELLPEMYEAIVNEDYDCVATRRATRKGESPIRSFFARMFYKLINRISKAEIVDGARDFRLMTRQVLDAVLSLTEYNRFSKGIFGWVGFKTKWIEYDNVPRAAGVTKWSFWNLFTYALDGIIGFSTAPLAISTFFALLLFLASFIGAVFLVVRRSMYGDLVGFGWAWAMCTVFFVGSIQLLCMGIFGQYLAKTYLESKQRPVYLIREKSED